MQTKKYFSKVFIFFLICFLSPHFIDGQEKNTATDLSSRLKSAKGIYVKRIDALPGFREGFELAIVQPVDHNHPDGAKFTQRVFLSHRDYTKPVVLETEGYGAGWPKARELAKILGANQVIVEHRYYESSKPKPLKWEYLTSWQAASDHHRVVEILKAIYPRKWISSGRSKGGMAALFHRAYYPNDVEATLTCVAPVMIGPVDSRFDTFLNTTGDSSFRAAVKQFQKTCLERRNELLLFLQKMVTRQKLVFPCRLEEVLERAVIEFPFSFCFGNHPSDEIPDWDAAPEKILDCLTKAVPLSGFSTAQIKYNAGLYYQQFTELGYFNYSVPHIEHLVQFVKSPYFTFYVPKEGLNAKFNGDAMLKVLDYLHNKGNNIIYLYGEYDIYTACAVELTGKTNAIKLIAKGFGHQFNIEDYPLNDKTIIYHALENWLNIQLNIK